VNVFAEVVFPIPVDRTFHYAIPEALRSRALAGCRITAPFGRRKMTGFIVALMDKIPPGPFDIKEIADVLDETPSFSGSFLSFSRRLGSRYFASWGEILQAALPPTLLPREEKKIRLTPLGAEVLAAEGLTKRDREVAILLRDGPRSPSYVAGKLGIKDPGPRLEKMQSRGLVETRVVARRPRPPVESGPAKAQRQLEFGFAPSGPSALAGIESGIAAGEFGSFYIMGPEDARRDAYARLIQATLAVGRRVIFLTPEISQAEALRGSGTAGPGSSAVLLHGRLAGRAREEEWRKLLEGRADVVVGPSSALLAPLAGVGLIVVDEESDESYDQAEGRLFDARGGARLRAEEEKAVFVRGSAWPSVEAYHEAVAGGGLIVLESGRRKFAVTVLDDRGEKGLLSNALKARLSERLGKGDPVILLVNRRGYSPYVFCPRCGHTPKCPRCDIAMGYHRKGEQWVCHYCNSRLPASSRCPKCGGTLVQRRAGGIEALEEEIRKLAPRAAVARFDSDEAGREKERDRVIDDFRRGRISILLATRLLFHRSDVPRVPFAVMLSPETLLGLSDYRASQKVFQSIAKMTGFVADDTRAEAVIQTSNPSHFSIRAAAAGDYRMYYDAEIEIRRAMNYPPFTRLAEVLFQGADPRSLARKSREFRARLEDRGGDIEVLGPALAAVARVRGRTQIQVILKSSDGKALETLLRESLEKIRIKKSVRLS
jgi:primosomal protein N' (replication factor Y) (superfamily II helicase)